MDLRLHLLESFTAKGSDGADYKVCAYERLVAVPGNGDQWEPTGQAEYRLADGRLVDVDAHGAMKLVGSGVVLTSQKARDRAETG